MSLDLVEMKMFLQEGVDSLKALNKITYVGFEMVI